MKYVILVCLALHSVDAIHHYSIRATKFVCTDVNKNYIQHIECSLKSKNRHTQLFSGNGTLLPNVTLTNVFVHLNAFLKFGSIFRKFFAESNVDLCMLYKNLVRTKIFKTTHLNAKMENLSLGCPVSGNRYAIDVKLIYEDYPQILPSGLWRLDHIISTTSKRGKRVPLLVSQQFFEVTYNSTEIF